MAGNLIGAQQRVPAKEASRIRREVEATSVIQDPAEFEPIPAQDEPIPRLKVYDDAWTCTVQPSCQFTALKVGSLKVHCAKEHRGVRPRSSYRVQEAQEDPWIRLRCQQMFPSQHGSNYFRVGPLTPAEDDSVPIDAMAEARQRVRDAQRALERRTIREMKDRQEGTEFVPWLERMGWPTYLQGLDRRDLMDLVKIPDAAEEALVAIVWDAMNDMLHHCQQTVKKHAGYFAHRGRAQ